jgi:outer membrane protein
MEYRVTTRSWKPVIAAVVLGVALQLSPTLALAQVKVGFVSISKVLEKAPQAESARERIEKEFAPRDRELLEQQKEIRSMEDKLVKNGAVMSASERQRQESEIRSLKREIRRLQDEFREDLNLRRSQELSKLQRMVTEVIQKLAKAESYDLIVTDGVIYAGERIDITDRVIGQLTAEFKKSN